MFSFQSAATKYKSKTNITMQHVLTSSASTPLPCLMKPFVTTSINVNPNIPTQYFNGNQLKTLYSIPTVIPASGKKQVIIAIIIAYSYPNLQSDLTNYWTNYSNFGTSNIPKPIVHVHTMSGATFDAGWALEECLDVQMVCTINPYANIWVVEATSSNPSDLLTAVQYASQILHADIISMSWGTDDTSTISTPKNNAYFTNPAVCYCASSGDANTVSWPAVSSNCMAIGGTTLLWNGGTNKTEFTWVNAGSGYSTTIVKPTYQSNVNMTTKRCIPDVSMIAGDSSLVYVYYSYKTTNPWIATGGTSVSTPLFAAILSLANQERFNVGKTALTTVSSSSSTHIQTYLYKNILTNSQKYVSTFNDISIGNDTAGNKSPIYNATLGFDIATGIGSPNATALCIELVTNLS